jgi:hypothetical protein
MKGNNVTRIGIMIFSSVLFSFVDPPPGSARELTGVLRKGLSVRTLTFTPQAAAAIAPAISGAVAQAVTQQFPLTSVSPAFTYRYNPAPSAFDRTTGVLGPLFTSGR